MANGNNNIGGAHSQMDALIDMSEVEFQMSQIYGSNWQEQFRSQQGQKSGSFSSLGNRVTTGERYTKPSLLNKLLGMFESVIPGGESGERGRNFYTSETAFPLTGQYGTEVPGGTQYYKATGKGSTKSEAEKQSKEIAMLKALYQPESYMQESPVATKGMQYDTPMSRGLEFLFSDVDKEGGKKMPGIASGGLALMAFLLANSLSMGSDTGKRK
jgi:hypothetical protein|tara:strand:- start:299 stop:940 length:642 start_codon:yes stop_codon:yes gene_type:complete